MRIRDVAWATAFFIPLATWASEPRGPNRLFRAAPSGISAVSTLLDAATLATSRRSGADSDLLVAAAHLAAMANPAPSSRAKRTEGGKSVSATKPIVLDPAKLLEAAGRSPAPSNAKALPPATSGKTFHQSERVLAGATDVFEISFKGADPAQAGIVGLGGADLDLRVFDEAWNEICASTTDSNREYCSWIPATTGMFRIRVRNPSSSDEDYLLVTN